MIQNEAPGRKAGRRRFWSAAMSDQILYPKATAVWLVDNTSMTFEQIADFCGLHHLEVKGIADGEVARDIRGADPIANGQLSREELEKAEGDPKYRMKALVGKHQDLLKTNKKAPRYTPVSRRQDRPDAIAWFLRNHPEVTDAQISKLLGTTKATIDRVKNHTHPNHANIKPRDPVYLGICSQMELDRVLLLANKRKQNKEKRDAREARAKARGADAAAAASETPAAEAANEPAGNDEN